MSCWGNWSLTTLACLSRDGDRTLGFEIKVVIGRRRLEFGGTQGRMELEEPLMNSFFLGLPLRALKGSLVIRRFWPVLAFFLSLLSYPLMHKRIEFLALTFLECFSIRWITHYSLNYHVKLVVGHISPFTLTFRVYESRCRYACVCGGATLGSLVDEVHSFCFF